MTMNMDYMAFHVFILWLNIVAIVLLVGGVVFCSTVLGGGAAALEPSSAAAVRAEGRRALRRWIVVGVLLLCVVSALDLALRTQMMSRKPLFEIAAILPKVLLQTHIGSVWLFKIGLLALLAVLGVLVAARPSPATWGLLWISAAALCLTSTLSGHAADKGDLSLPVLVDWTHFFTLSIWAGGLFPLRWLLPKLAAPLEKSQRLKFEAGLLGRFSTMAVLAVALLTLSGVVNAWLRLQSPSNLFSTAYGVTLLFKLVFILPLLGLGAVNRYYVRPCLLRLAGEAVPESFGQRWGHRLMNVLGGGGADEPRLQSGYHSEQMTMIHLKLFVAVECVVALMVLALAALLTQTPPPGPPAMGGAMEMMDHSM